MSRYSDRSSSTGRPSWRQRGSGNAVHTPQTPNKSVWRWLLTFLLLVLLSGFIYWVWPNPRGHRYLFVTALWATDQLRVPPLAMVREDLDALRQTPDVEFHDATGEGQDEASFEAFADRIAKTPREGRDTLILYLAAHGGADDRGPYLICSDFGRSEDRGRCAIRSLLDKVSQSSAGLTVLILDVGRLNYDPRLGILGNEFTSQLVKEVERHQSSKVWILLATRTAEGTALDYGARQSVFGRAVAEALAGEATRRENGGDGDRFVDLSELTRYVQAACHGWFGEELTNYQNPILLRTSQGLVTDEAIPRDQAFRLNYVDLEKLDAEKAEAEVGKESKEPVPAPTTTNNAAEKKASAWNRLGQETTSLALLWQPAPAVGPKAKLEQPAGTGDASASQQKSETPAKSADAATKPPEETAKSSDDAAKQPPAGQPGPQKEADPSRSKQPSPAAPAATNPETKAKSAEAAPLSIEQKLRLESQRLWELRDRLRGRQATTGMSPVDFAPHIWREAEAWLLYYEQRLRSGRVIDSQARGDARDAEDLELRLRDMRTLAAELERLLAAMNGAATSGSRDEKSVGDRLLAAWQRYVLERQPADDQFEREAGELLRDTRQAARRLADQIHDSIYFVRWFGQAAMTLPDASRYRDAIGGYLVDLTACARELRQLERTPIISSQQSRLNQFLEHQKQLAESERQLREDLAALEQESLDRIAEPVAQLRVDGLLATPWLSAPRRGKLFDALRLPRSRSVVARGFAAPSIPAENRSRLLTFRRDCLQLESKLIELADEDTAKQIATLAQSIGATEGEDAEDLRLQGGTKKVAAFYTALPRSLTSDLALFLVDPRDAPLVDANKYPLPAFEVELEQTAELRLVPLARMLQFQQGKPTTLSVTLRATKRNLLDARLVPSNRDGLLTFELLPEQELPPERGWYAKTVQWRVTAKPEAISEQRNVTTIVLVAEAAGLTASETVDVDLPQPNRVDVFFTRLGSSESTGGAASDMTLDVFSNRKTRFQCALVNQHDEPKTVQVTLYAISPRPNSRSPIGRIDASIRREVYDASAKLFLEPKPVARSEKPVELPAADPNKPQQERVLFNWIHPNAVPPTAPAAPGQPPAATSVPPSEPIQGLVLEIVDTKNSDQVWIKWIELEPLSPRDFLDISVGYDQRQRQIIARLKPKKFDNQGEPELPAGKPVFAEWDPSDANLPSQGKKNLAGEIDASTPRPEAVLQAEVEPDGRDRIVKIGIDGYPRAFLYQVSCRRDTTEPDLILGQDLARETTSVRIDSITVPSQNRVYHFLPDFQPPPPPTDEKAPKVEHLLLAPRQPALFRAPAETLVVRLQADAPIDAFRSENDRVSATLRENSFTRVVRADREVLASCVGCGPRGMLELETIVSDLTMRLSPGTLENVQTVVDADIRFGDRDDADSVFVQLDGDDPRIAEVQMPRSVAKEGKALVRFFVSDFHGVAKVVFGFSKDGSRRLAEADAQTLAVTSRRDDDGRHVFDLEMDLKGQPVGRKLLLFKVVDHVGHESQLDGRELFITDVAAMPTTGEVRGVIRYGPAKVNGSVFKMTIEGGELGPTPVPIQPDGSFLISNLPIAEYTLKVLEGTFSGKSVPPKEQKGVKPADPKKPQVMTLDVRG